MRHVAPLLTLVLGALAIGLTGEALYLLVDGIRDVIGPGPTEVRVSSLVTFLLAFLMAGLARQFFRMSRTRLTISRRVRAQAARH